MAKNEDKGSTAKLSRTPYRMSVTIHFDEHGKCTQLVRPTAAFDGTIKDLVNAITGGSHHRFEVNDQ